MGSSHSSGSHSLVQDGAAHDPGAPSLRFHRICGDNIRLEEEGFRARRPDSFCKGVLFSNRPIVPGEKVCFRVTDLSSKWTGALRVGFSAHDPAIMGSGSHLPKYACPDLTSKPGYWAKALPERYVEQNVLIQYHVLSNGEVHIGVNGQNKGEFFSGVDARRPLWALIDLYGNCAGIELIDVRRSLNNFHRVTHMTEQEQIRHLVLQQQQRHHLIQQQQQQQQQPQQQQYQQLYQTVIPTTADPQVQLINGRMAGMTLRRNSQQQQRILVERHEEQFLRDQQQLAPPQLLLPSLPPATNAVQPQPPAPPSTENFLPLRHNLHAAFRPLCFHFCTGRYVSLSESSMVASRHADEFAQGYVFTAAPIRVGERIVVQILGTESSYIGSMAFGLTNADPSSFDTRELPEDADALLDRSEYWVVSKDVASSPGVGEELSFLVQRDGSVEFSKSGQPPQVFMHVDVSQRLWAFFDVYGHTSKIRILGSTPDPLTREQLPPPAPVQSGGQLPPAPSPLVNINSTAADDASGAHPVIECTVCYERPVDCAIYTCGHMCMCYGCAMQQWKGRGGGFCPICREDIRDVIRTYRA